MDIVNCPNCREGKHDICYLISEVTRNDTIVWCACWEEGHTQEKATNMGTMS